MPHPLKSPATLLALAFGIVGVGLVLHAWELPPFTSPVRTTENAYVRGKVTFLAPQVAGHIAEVEVQDYQTVTAGQLLARIDDRIYVQQLAQAQAQLEIQQADLDNYQQDRASAEASIRSAEASLESAEASLRAAQANWDRIEPLRRKGVVNQADTDTARATLDSATAGLHEAQAALDISQQELRTVESTLASLKAGVENARAAKALAQIDLDNTRILAPVDGRVGEVSARVGQYVSAGTQLMGLVPHQTWVVANFKETQVKGMTVGQPATVRVDALGGVALTGHITSFAPATGSEFSVIKTDNATGNFTKVTQRLPVKIEFDTDQTDAARLVPGLSVVVSVDTDAHARPAGTTAQPGAPKLGSAAPQQISGIRTAFD